MSSQAGRLQRELRVHSARDLGAQFVTNPHRMVGQDGAYSIPLAHGEALWFFGDTLIGSRVPHESLWYPGGQQLGPGDMTGNGSIELMLNNTGLILRQNDGRNGLTNYSYILDGHGQLKQLVPRLPREHRDEIRVWCLHGCCIGRNVYLYYLNVRMLSEGPMPVNFELVGSGLAKAVRGEWDFQSIEHDGDTMWWKVGLPHFGSAVLMGNDGYVYAYGVKKDPAGVQQCCLARVTAESICDYDAYEYLCSPEPRWCSMPDEAQPIMTGMPNEMSVSWNAHLGSYLAVHSLDLTGSIVARTAPQPWGPWSDPVELWKVTPPQIDYTIPYPPLIYAGKEHPELAAHFGRTLYLTYIEFEEYFPHLIEVTLE